MSHIKNLVLKMDDFELNIKELVIPEKGITAILGSSGSGKTTFLKTLIGLYEPQGWSWTFKGELLSGLDIGSRRLGVVFQNYDLFPHLTAEENINLVLKARNSEKAARLIAQNKVEKYISQLNLVNCRQTRAQNLSGGEKQRVALLRALVSNPRILLLDEPFAALDTDLRSEARLLVKEVLSQLDIPVYLVTHDKEDVTSLAENVIHLKNGKLIQ